MTIQPGLLFAQVLQVENYQEPQGVTKIYSYSSRASGQQPWNYQGIFTETSLAPETINGIERQVRLRISEGLPDYFPAESKIFYYQMPDGLYSAYHDDVGELHEYLQLPTSLQKGESWQGPSAYWDEEVLENIDTYSSEAGDFASCLYVRRNKDITEPPQKLSSLTVYCPQIGAVLSTIDHRMDEFESTTETRLISTDQ